MANVSVDSDCAGDSVSRLIHGAFEGFTVAAERLEQAYADLSEQVTALNGELYDTNLRLTHSLQENTRIHRYLSNLLASIEKGIAVVDSAGRITLWSRGAERLTGCTAAEAVGRQTDQLLGEDAADLIRRLAEGGPDGAREGRITRQDGQNLEAEIGASPIYDEDGRMLDTLLIFDDISRRKWVEERRRRSTAQAGLEQMAVTIAHGIRNPLTSIELLATLLAEETQADRDRSRLAQGIQAGVAAVNTVLTNLLAFTRPVKPRVRSVDLREVIEEAMGTAWYALKEQQIDPIRSYDPDPLEVDADQELVKQVFLNLILNAVQAMPSGGRLRISAGGSASGSGASSTGPEAADHRQAGRCPDSGGPGGGEYIEVKVSDSGSGIADADLDKIFLPFFTTKPKGAGLGLAIVERILEQHGARASLESRLGEGTTFTILFRRRCPDATSSKGDI